MPELFTTPFFNDANLISYWRMEGNSNDSKGTNNGTDTAITYSKANGKFGQGAGFNGTSSKIVIPDSANLSALNSFTVVAWVNPTGLTAADQYQIVTRDAGSPNREWQFCITPDASHVNTMRVVAFSSPTTFSVVYSNTSLSNSSWQHAAFTYNGSNVIFYLNGLADGNPACSQIITNTASTTDIGDQNGSGFFKGNIDDVAIFNRVLTATEIFQLYLSGHGLGLMGVGS